MSGLQIFTLAHVIISLIGILTGLLVAIGFLGAKPLGSINSLFLWTTLLTSLTGFLFPFRGFKPSYAVGILSVIALAIALYAFYSKHLAGGWRRGYVITAMIALYFNVFVLVFQLFDKVPALHGTGPTGSEPAFKVSQLVTMLVFIVWTVLAVKKCHPAALQPA
jgi:hypothetical protein